MCFKEGCLYGAYYKKTNEYDSVQFLGKFFPFVGRIKFEDDLIVFMPGRIKESFDVFFSFSKNEIVIKQSSIEIYEQMEGVSNYTFYDSQINELINSYFKKSIYHNVFCSGSYPSCLYLSKEPLLEIPESLILACKDKNFEYIKQETS